MSAQRMFPLQLLEQPNKVRLAYYDAYTMGHPHLDTAFETLKLLVRNSGDSRIIFIVGPTGVGKTKLRLLAEKWVSEEFLSDLETDRGCIPIVSVEAVLQKSGLFNAKDHLKRSLYALNEPKQLVEHKINYGVQGIRHNQAEQLVIESRILETELGWALEQALKYRKPKVFFIDEAHHMLSVASGRKLTDVPEAIKSLSNRTEVLHGLLGTYELLTLHDVGDQLSRRSTYIHLPRYNAKFTEDREDWQSIVWGFQLQLPTVKEPDFLSHWEYLYERSLGCVGILKNWTRNALADALEEESKTVTLKHLERRVLSVGQCRNILKKIQEGEERYTEIEGKVEILRSELGLELKTTSSSNKSQKQQQEANQAHRRYRSVGQRKPTRDRVGVEKNVR